MGDEPIGERINGNQVAQARKRFEQDLFEKHLDEASFLYDQRLTIIQKDNFEWTYVVSYEERLKKHLSALVDLGSVALDFCKEQHQDPGGLYATVCLLCRHGTLDALGDVLGCIDAVDDESFAAGLEGLKHALPEHWKNNLHEIIDPESDRFVDIASMVYGYRRWPLDDLPRLNQREIRPSLAWAIGRSGSPAWLDMLLTAFDNDEDATKQAAAIALLRHGRRDHISKLIENAKDQSWPMLPLSLGGDPTVQQHLIRIAKSNPSKDGLLALGVLGDWSSVDTLLAAMTEEDLASDASFSLNLITGADLYEEVFVPEEIDEDTLFDEELEKHKNGESLYPPGEEPGETVMQLSKDPNRWKEWWISNRSRFRPGMRYRLGKPYSPVTLVDILELPGSPNLIRKIAYEELVIRYKAKLPFEIEMPVIEQLAVIKKYRRWSHNNQRLFKAGAWYYQGVC